jgi:hypothetical protein
MQPSRLSFTPVAPRGWGLRTIQSQWSTSIAGSNGVENLRVVDASIMPTIPRANINLTCIMIGERLADWMQEEA